MGYPKLTYEDYYDHLDYYKSRGIELPKWADVISALGYHGVSAIDFYDDIFGEELEEHRLPEDYQVGEYGGIAVEKIMLSPSSDGEPRERNRRVTITRGNLELYDLIDDSENFCIIAPVSYAGLNRTNKNARHLYALTIEIDDIKPKTGVKELFYSWRRKILTMPRPTYVVCSGSGLHLYFVFERPVACFPHIWEQLSAVKKYFTNCFWNCYVTKSHEKVQYESLNQAFRCVGSITKSGNAYAMAFKTGDKITIENLNERLPKDMEKIDSVYKSKLSLATAKELYPEWYQRRIVDKQARGHWNRHEGIYYNWIEKTKKKARVGHRYHCLENLCSLAVQCQIPKEQVLKDCEELAECLEALTLEEDNHFTDKDIKAALQTYNKPDEQAYRRNIEFVAKKTGIPLVPAKRNYNKQADHLEEARAIRDIRMKRQGRKWTDGNGRPSKQVIVQEWRKTHPDGWKIDCQRDTGLDPKTIRKWWGEDTPKPKAKRKFTKSELLIFWKEQILSFKKRNWTDEQILIGLNLVVEKDLFTMSDLEKFFKRVGLTDTGKK